MYTSVYSVLYHTQSSNLTNKRKNLMCMAGDNVVMLGEGRVAEADQQEVEVHLKLVIEFFPTFTAANKHNHISMSRCACIHTGVEGGRRGIQH